MVIFLVLILLLIGSILVNKFFNDVWEWDMFSSISMLLCCIMLAMCLIGIPVQYYDTMSKVSEFHSVQLSLDAARHSVGDIENAAIQQKVIDENKWLSSVQYYNGTIWGLWTPDTVMQLKPIK
jgi:hypothetical protein